MFDLQKALAALVNKARKAKKLANGEAILDQLAVMAGLPVEQAGVDADPLEGVAE